MNIFFPNSKLEHNDNVNFFNAFLIEDQPETRKRYYR